ncbi:MAG: MFS transporter, partial [Opitutaceae bacterium]
TVWVLSYATTKLGVARGTILNAVLLGSALQLVVVPWFGALSDRVGRRPVYLGGTVFLLVFAFGLFPLLNTRDPYLISAAIIAGLLGHAALYGPQAALFAELFGTRTRYTGASLGYQLAAPFAGGLAPLVAAALLGWSGGSPWPVAVYLAVLAVLTIIAVVLVPETSRSDLARAGGAAAGEKDA